MVWQNHVGKEALYKAAENEICQPSWIAASRSGRMAPAALAYYFI